MPATRKLTFGLIYGLAAGMFFSIMSWGLNAYLLDMAHFAYPWLAFSLGLLPTLLISGLAGFLTIRMENALLGAIAWLVAGILVAALGVWIPLGLVPDILPKFEPILKGWVEFTWQDSYTFLVYSAMISSGVAFVIASVLESVLVEQAAFSIYASALVMPILVCALITGSAGGIVDNLVNARYRDSAVALDNVFEFAIDNKGKTIDPELERKKHLGAVSMILDDLTKKHSLYYFSYNETGQQAKILVDLNGKWALCDISLNQPVFCRPILPPQ